MHDLCVLTSQEVQALGLEAEERVEPIEPPLVQSEIPFEDRELLRNVADLILEGADLRGDVRDLGSEPAFFGACGGDPPLNLAELATVVAGSRGREKQPGNEDEGQLAGHERRFGSASDVPAGRGKAPQAPARPSSGSSGPSGPGSGMIAGSGGFPSSGGG